ncbi:MAG TPA: AAA family ATPase [Candidatus Binataceae bacterium]|nr:AAA family ATPase [Candidatus Binataceae bacterium]
MNMMSDGETLQVSVPLATQNGKAQAKIVEVKIGIRADHITLRSVEWLWPGYFPLGKVSEIGGEPDRRKSILLVELASHVSTGRPWFDWTECPHGHVLYFAAEDDATDTIAPRLVAAQADLSYVTPLGTKFGDPIHFAATGQKRLIKFYLPTHIPILEQLIKQWKVKLVMIDPLPSFLDPRRNTNSDAYAREVIDELKELAERYNCAIIVCRHLNKGGGGPGGNPLHRMSGSNSFSAAARASHVVDFDPTDETKDESKRRSVLLKMKNNISAPVDGLLFGLEIVPITVEAKEGKKIESIPRIEWLGATKLTAAQLMFQQQRRTYGETPKEEANRTHEAIEFLQLCLADEPRAMREVQADALALGINERTLRRARERLKIRSVKGKGKKNAPWCWALPTTATTRLAVQSAGKGK